MTTEAPMTTSNRADLLATIGTGVVVAIVTLVGTILRIIEIVPNQNVPVLVPFVDTETTLPLGPDGGDVTVQVEQATVLVSDLAPASLVSLVLAELVTAAAILTVTALIVLLCRNILAGRTFNRSNTRYVAASSIVIAAGWAVGGLFTTMGVNGTFAALSDRQFDGAIFTLNWMPVLFAMVLGALALGFRHGERVQRDTEGLI